MWWDCKPGSDLSDARGLDEGKLRTLAVVLGIRALTISEEDIVDQ